MHPNQRQTTLQQRRVRHHVEGTDSYTLFNLLTGPQMLDSVEELLPKHRERLLPPTETLSMFLAQALSSDGSCREAVNAAALKRIVDGRPRCNERRLPGAQALASGDDRRFDPSDRRPDRGRSATVVAVAGTTGPPG